ncbi:MAG: hypothetical protein WA210_18085 [Burkholderiaceae bacterium]
MALTTCTDDGKVMVDWVITLGAADAAGAVAAAADDEAPPQADKPSAPASRAKQAQP